MADPDGSFCPVAARNSDGFEFQPVQVFVIKVVHTAFQTIQMNGVCSAVYGTVQL